MRAARLPNTLAVHPPSAHYIVVATNHSLSYKHACDEHARWQQQQQQRQQHTSRDTSCPVVDGVSAVAVTANAVLHKTATTALPSHHCFRVHDLLPCDWAALLSLCRDMMQPTASYTVSSPGSGGSNNSNSNSNSSDHSSISSSSSSSSGSYRRDDDSGAGCAHVPERSTSSLVTTSAADAVSSTTAVTLPAAAAARRDDVVVNEAVMHIVERVRDDFVPNNAIYHHLRRYCDVSLGTPAFARDYVTFLRALQTDKEGVVGDADCPGVDTVTSSTAPAPRTTMSTSATSTNTRDFRRLCAQDDDGGANDDKRHGASNEKVAHAPLSSSSPAPTAAATTAAASAAQTRAAAHSDLLDSVDGGCYTAQNLSLTAHFASYSATVKSGGDAAVAAAGAAGASAANATARATGLPSRAAAASDAAAHMHDELQFMFYPHRVGVAASLPYCSAHFAVLVNLKPIVPLHLLIVPLRCVASLCCLTKEERRDWGHVMALTLRVLTHVHATYTRDAIASRCGAARDGDSCHTRREGDSGHTHDGGSTDKAHTVHRDVCTTATTTATTAASLSATITDYSIAIQQGALAGQTVPHLHTHVIPFDPHGRLAGEPELSDEEEARCRRPRSEAAMRAETEWLKPLFATLA